MKDNILEIIVANSLIRLIIKDENLFLDLETYFECNLYSQQFNIFPFCTIIISKEKNSFIIKSFFHSKRKKIEEQLLISNTTTDILYFIIKVIIARFVIFNDTLLLHASSIEINDKAYLFCGPSHEGKSTIIKNFNFDGSLSDDTAILKKDDNSVVVYTSPFDNRKMPSISYKKITLGCIFFISQSKKNAIYRLNWPKALHQFLISNFIYQFFYPLRVFSRSNTEFINIYQSMQVIPNFLPGYQRLVIYKLYKLTMDLVLKIPFYKLCFTKDFRLNDLAHLINKSHI